MIRFSPALHVGQAAPNFSSVDATGKTYTLADFARTWVVLFFYPTDFTPGCTIESCQFRDKYPDFREAGAQLVGVSGDSVKLHRDFAAQYQLPYILLSDPDASMRRAYTVPHILGRLSGRTSFVIDPKGLIRYVFDSRGQFREHVTRTLEFLKQVS